MSETTGFLERPDGERLAWRRVAGRGPAVVWLGGFRGAAGQAELVEPDEPDLGTLVLGRPQRRLQQDLGAAVRLTAAQPEHPPARVSRRHLVLLPMAC